MNLFTLKKLKLILHYVAFFVKCGSNLCKNEIKIALWIHGVLFVSIVLHIVSLHQKEST